MADGHNALLFSDIKVCKVCKRGFPRTAEFFPRTKVNSDGLQGKCKECTAAYYKKRRDAMSPEQRKADNKRQNSKRDAERAARMALPKPPKVYPETKWCPGCKQHVPRTLEFWSTCKSQPGGLQAYCKVCQRRRQKELRERDPDAARAKDRAAYAANPERARETAKRFHQTEKGQIYRRNANKRRREKHWLHMRMATAIRRVIGVGKGSSKWMEYLGYTVEELERHLVRQFTKGMTLEKLRQGKLINIDHIVPLAHFGVVSGPDDPNFKAAWALSNLRPCWAKINQQKGAKRLFLL